MVIVYIKLLYLYYLLHFVLSFYYLLLCDSGGCIAVTRLFAGWGSVFLSPKIVHESLQPRLSHILLEKGSNLLASGAILSYNHNSQMDLTSPSIRG